MDKEQVLHDFWSSFNLKAYDSNTVPDDAELPYITYDVSVSNFEVPVALNASLWYRSYSWDEITQKAHDVEKRFGYNGVMLKFDDGYIWLKRSNTPFAQRMTDENDTIRRIVISYEAEFLSAY